MESINKQIDRQLNIIIDRYLKLSTPIKNIKKYLTGKNIKTIIDELYDLEDIYIKRSKNKTGKDFKNLIKKMIIKILKDREYDIKDTSESLKHVKLFEDFFDDFDYEESPKIDEIYCKVVDPSNDEKIVKTGTARECGDFVRGMGKGMGLSVIELTQTELKEFKK